MLRALAIAIAGGLLGAFLLARLSLMPDSDSKLLEIVILAGATLAHAQVVIETWRREYNEERPTKGLGRLTPAAYAQQLTARTKTATVTAGL